MKILVLGANGMLGNVVFRFFSNSPGYEVYGSVRTSAALNLLPDNFIKNITSDIDVGDPDRLMYLFNKVKPNIVINCIGLVKQLARADDPLIAIPMNSVLPHRIERLCEIFNARFIHISTDCVFSGKKGMYIESDIPDANDLYGCSKFLGEVKGKDSITLRTSIIGHELIGCHSLIDWFLSQSGSVSGYSRAVFSGLPTVELARIIRDNVIPLPDLFGLYHVSAEPINKYELLREVAKIYQKNIEIYRDDNLDIDRSLDSTRFRNATGYHPETWPTLIRAMYNFR